MSRLSIPKTYKLFIGGKFPRTESGRVTELTVEGQFVANVCQASRKDLRNAVTAARGAFDGWAGSSAYLKGQILYRIAEVLDGRASQFIEELVAQGVSGDDARGEVEAAIDLLVHYAGWSDKYQALFSTVNPVASPHFNFSRPEPMGVVGIIAPRHSGLAGLVSVLAPAIVGGNACVVLASGDYPLTAISLAEVLATSDVPGGVVNLLTGSVDELAVEFAKHRDINALLMCGGSAELRKTVEIEAADNLKRVSLLDDGLVPGNPYSILDLNETKTTWHPVGV
ncbi:MAG: aldehyde dehydrogenase family protein [Verrucomicrobiota bacterium JB023]|nr:aldehyde dehydrogenase family protein [Verrucomicrobiota bacterium JB023]